MPKHNHWIWRQAIHRDIEGVAQARRPGEEEPFLSGGAGPSALLPTSRTETAANTAMATAANTAMATYFFMLCQAMCEKRNLGQVGELGHDLLGQQRHGVYPRVPGPPLVSHRQQDPHGGDTWLIVFPARGTRQL